MQQAQGALVLAPERQRLAAETEGLLTKAFSLGESDLATRLRTAAERYAADADAARNRLEAGRTIFRLNQAFGVVPCSVSATGLDRCWRASSLFLPRPAASSATGRTFYARSAWSTSWPRMKSFSAAASGARRTPQMPSHCAMLERGMCSLAGRVGP